MQILNLIQGSEAWKSHRATAFNASDAPAMLGISKYKSRSQLIKERATGIVPEVDDATQRRFNDGHRFEALARPLAEKIIGEELSPVTGMDGKYSASFDGITFGNDITFEHKLLNADLRDVLTRGESPDEQYCVQMEHQLMVSGANKCLFMASSWDADDNLIEEVHCWYLPNTELRARIIAGWEQFEIDVAAYQHMEIQEKPKGEAIMDLPSLTVQASGMVTYSNLPEFKRAAQDYIDNINTSLVTDQDFANAETTVKFCKATEEKLEVTKSAVLAQTASIDEVIRTVDHIQAQLREKRLMLDKLVKSEKESRKVAMVSSASGKFADHLAAIQSEIAGVRMSMLITSPDFGAAIKGLKSLASMQDALDTALANGKIAADTIAKDVRAKLAWCKGSAAGHSALFPDLQQIIVKPMDDFTLTITSRIERAKADEAARLEEQRKRIESEAKAKAEREAAAKLAEETARIRAEEQAKAKAEAEARVIDASNPKAFDEAKPGDIITFDSAPESGEAVSPQTHSVSVEIQGKAVECNPYVERPTDKEVIDALQVAFGISYGEACDLILAVAESLKVAA